MIIEHCFYSHISTPLGMALGATACVPAHTILQAAHEKGASEAPPCDTHTVPIADNAPVEAVVGFWFMGQRHFPKMGEGWVEDASRPMLLAVQAWVAAYLTGVREAPYFALAPQGTAFQQAVWRMLLAIPYGTLTTYGAMGQQLSATMGGKRMSARAVGSAVGRNPITLLIPCHRVVGAGGKLTGFASGLENKKALLALEHASFLQ
ncbi:methylated-DNA--[protein]-cysteine S-methyltransferase [Desulfovibrio cuneatus]|uniref:methylated-DNA--[protein]-cysteine S-methyltransferase n=1 Tax=Desulfovibrio cuneatus TaxID=159728 RepID=UPI00040FAC7A|nr:methylated-DNA--[protein]-cysteine S-methyltransferase [Desulfovibrio cuneatus]